MNIVSAEEIKDGKITDVYFQRSQQILGEQDIDKKVRMEVRLKSLPEEGDWGLFVGLDEVLELLEGKGFTVWSLREGAAFRPYEPVLSIEADYREFAPLETPLLGFLCQASGVATKARRIKRAAQDKPVYHFGSRRMHPAIAPMIGRSAFIGGCDGVAVTETAQRLGLEPVGTIPHALVLLLEDSTTATSMFKETFGDRVTCVALVDTFGDEKFEALENADLIEGLDAVRLDTPSSRRGDMLDIAREVRWELDLNGFEDVDIFISGGLGEEEIEQLNDVADAYGVGTAISNSPVLDFALDIVEIEGEPIAKRGKRSGGKKLFSCPCGQRKVLPRKAPRPVCEECGPPMKEELTKVMEEGEPTREKKGAKEIRDFSISQSNFSLCN